MTLPTAGLSARGVWQLKGLELGVRGNTVEALKVGEQWRRVGTWENGAMVYWWTVDVNTMMDAHGTGDG
jgi:hypothetical protein